MMRIRRTWSNWSKGIRWNKKIKIIQQEDLLIKIWIKIWWETGEHDQIGQKESGEMINQD